MISPDEIRKIALRWWKPFLQSVIREETFFPKRVERVGKVKAGDITQRFDILQKEIDVLYLHSKSKSGKGYLVVTGQQNFRRTGTHELPDAIEFETVQDFLHFLNKENEWKTFLENFNRICSEIPALKTWSLENCLSLTHSNVEWENLLKVCSFFLETPRPDLYIRQLPIQVHTKFIEENTSLLISLLDFLIPNEIRNSASVRIAERYYLRYDQPLIRMRFLDRNENCGGFTDLSLPLSDFNQINLSAKNILITENKMNFLALPAIDHTVACWSGGGFNISHLKNANWLHGKNIFYWGDIDEHGFQILHQLRSYYPHAQSIMMDQETFQEFEKYTAKGAQSKAEELSTLTDPEKELFRTLKTSDKNRLEQEKIPQKYSNQELIRKLS